MGSPSNDTHAKAKPNYFVIFLMLVGLVFLAIGVSFMNLGSSAVYVNLAIAGTQACLLGYFFMHVKGADQMTWLAIGAAVFWIFILFVLLLMDYFTRQIAAY